MAAIPVWDPLVRICHWLVATLFFANFWLLEAGETPHEWVGYSIASLVAMRLVWGFTGPANARIVHFWPTPARINQHLKNIRAPVAIGHNPLGGAMILFLWFMLLLAALSGWLQTTDKYWGEEWVENVHNFSADIVMVAVAIHIAAVLIMPRINGTALVVPMVTGRRKQHALDRKTR
tara:strand:+ start:140768 stop:141298 length:531 start_codon:yes stop_codon:yes gene_type:complete